MWFGADAYSMIAVAAIVTMSPPDAAYTSAYGLASAPVARFCAATAMRMAPA
jgi:hypothetical protein